MWTDGSLPQRNDLVQVLVDDDGTLVCKTYRVFVVHRCHVARFGKTGPSGRWLLRKPSDRRHLGPNGTRNARVSWISDESSFVCFPADDRASHVVKQLRATVAITYIPPPERAHGTTRKVPKVQ